MGQKNPKKGPGRKAARRRKDKKRHTKSCVGKRQHPKKDDALDTLHQLKDETGAVGMSIYKCRVCSHWHVGHRPRQR